MPNTAYFAKASFLTLLLFLESFFLTKFILSYIKTQNYFKPPLDFMAIAILLMLAIAMTNSLLVGTWLKWHKYIFSPAAISLGVFLVVFPIDQIYGFLISILIYLFICYDIFFANQLKTQLIVFNPRLILKFSTKGILFIFCVIAGVLVLLTAHKDPEINIGERVSDVVDRYLVPKINYQINSQVEDVMTQQKDKLTSFGISPEQADFINKSRLISSFATPDLKVGSVVTDQVNKVIEPYKKFIIPIIALIVFSLFQLLSFISYVMYWLIIDILFWIAKKTKLFHIDTVPASQEILHF